jgi:hypothetical protein
LANSFTDPYTSLNESNVAFFGNRSFVIHNAAGDRIACANWTASAPPASGDDGDDGGDDGGDDDDDSCDA